MNPRNLLLDAHESGTSALSREQTLKVGHRPKTALPRWGCPRDEIGGPGPLLLPLVPEESLTGKLGNHGANKAGRGEHYY